MQQAVGGSVLTVADDVHGSVPQAPECAAKLVAYFDTGRAARHDRCAGIPEPGTTSVQGRVQPDTFRLFKR
jgi:hypothetical protein